MLDIIKEQGIVAVLRADSHEQAREYMNACVKGGIKALELTYSIPNVNELIEEYKDNKCRLQAERKSLLTSLERLHQEQPDFSNQIAHKQKLLAEIATIYDFVLDPNVSNEDKGNALRRVLKKIVFDRKTSVFTFFYYVS